MPAPSTYSEWVCVIEKFRDRENDADTLCTMREGTIEWQSGVAERFSKKLIDAVNARMNWASDKFNSDMGRAGGSDGAIVQAILALRKEMCFLKEALCIRAIPEKEREHYVRLVCEQADNMQKSLEDSAKKDRSGKMSSIVRNHRVNMLN